MPIYEYGCTKCGNIEEALQKFSDKPLKKCRHCSGKLQKLISHSAFHLKGSGWYVTDYANKSSANASATKSKEDKPAKKEKKSKKAAGDNS
jgi:putative FmdB family regulatory protein